MAFELIEDTKAKVGGTTLWGRGASRPTAIYMPKRQMVNSTTFDVMVWLHGFYVYAMEDILKEYADNNPDGNGDPRLKQQVLDSGKELIIVAPYLGKVPHPVGKKEREAATTPDLQEKVRKKDEAYAAGKARYRRAEADFGQGNAAADYLNEVLEAIGAYAAQQKAVAGGKPPPAVTPQLGRLYIGCHSGGGEGMLNLLGALGSHESKLKECWGFDCIYSTRYAGVAASNPKVCFRLYMGRGSSFTSSHAAFLAKYGDGGKNKPVGGLDRMYLAPATGAQWIGVEDDKRAFADLATIKAMTLKGLSYESFRRDLDAKAGNATEWVSFLNQNTLKLRDHFETPATLLKPRIVQSL